MCVFNILQLISVNLYQQIFFFKLLIKFVIPYMYMHVLEFYLVLGN